LRERTRNFLSRFVAIFLIASGLLSSFRSLFSGIPWECWFTVYITVYGIIGVWAWITTRPEHLAPTLVTDSRVIEEKAILEVPAPYKMLVLANKHARSIYGRDSIPLEKVEKWWLRNPFVEAVLYKETGEYLGYFDVLPLTAEGEKLIESGKIKEREISPECILSPLKTKNANTVYLSGVAVKDAGTENGKMRAAKLLYSLACYLEYYYKTDGLRVLALAATPVGERLLKEIGAKIVSPKDVRKDKHDLYEIVLTSELLSQIKSRAVKRAEPPILLFKPSTEY